LLRLPGIVLVHLAFSMPVMTLLFRNHYLSLPQELFKAARIDGGGFWRIFWQLMLPMSTPIIIVAAIMQVTGVWNDYVLGLVFAGAENLPMTVQLNNVINTTTGERLYNVNMAATILTSAGAAAAVPRVRALVRARHHGRRGEGMNMRMAGRERCANLGMRFGGQESFAWPGPGRAGG
jgi:ABC-type glycerol-3-phosphate transport system permease component